MKDCREKNILIKINGNRYCNDKDKQTPKFIHNDWYIIAK